MARRKIYYPQGQITPGLYTTGKEWMLEDGTEYIGDYHSYYTGEVFTRATYIKNRSEKLIPYVDLKEEARKESFQYDKLKSVDSEKFVFAIYKKPTPVENDYSNGFFKRYFLKRHFQDIITEVGKSTFQDAKEEYYIKVEIPWKLTGPLNDQGIDKGVFDTNRRIILIVEKEMVGIRNYVTNYIEYARISS